MPDYAKLATTTKRLIDKSGRPVTIVRLATNNDDGSKPWRGNATPRVDATEVAGIAVFVPLSSNTFLGQESNLEPDRRGNQVALFAAKDDQDNDLTKFDEIKDETGERWKIVQGQLLRPGSTKLLYAFEVKR